MAYSDDVQPSGIIQVANGSFSGNVGSNAVAICNVDLSAFPDASFFIVRLKRIKMQFHSPADSYAAFSIYAGLSSSASAAIDLTDQYSLANFDFKEGVATNIDQSIRSSAMIQLLGVTNESNPAFTHCWYWGGSRSFDGERLYTEQIADITRIKYLNIIATPTNIWSSESIVLEADYAVYAV